jgi:hypothetical protein
MELLGDIRGIDDTLIDESLRLIDPSGIRSIHSGILLSKRDIKVWLGVAFLELADCNLQ